MRARRFAWPALAAALAVAIYLPVMRVPLIYDTLLHIRIAGGLTLRSVWLPTEAFGFYRPLTFVPLLLVQRAFGGYPAALLNAMNIAQHALNAALLVWLIGRLAKWHTVALVAGLLFALFPFSYQAVAVYGHNVHPAITNLLLLGIHCLLNATTEGRVNPARARWYAVAGVLFGLALLTHESAILFGPLAALVLLAQEEQPPWPLTRPIVRRYAAAIVFTLAGLAYLLLYQLLPITRAPQTAGAADLSAKLLYLLQAAAYPLAQLLNAPGRLPALPVIGLAVGLTLAWTALAGWRGGWPVVRRLLLGWGWWLAASVLIAVPLPAGYLVNGPRLLYVGGVGLALVWAVLLSPPLAQSARVSYTVGLALIVLLLFANGRFVRARLADYATLTAGIPLLHVQLRADEGVLLVNLPQWTAPPRNTFPLGAEFVQQLGNYLFAEEWTGDNLGRRVPTRAVALPELLRSTDYGYAVHDQHSWSAAADLWQGGGATILLTQYENAAPVPEITGWLVPPAAGAPPTLAQIGPYHLHGATAMQCGDQITLTSIWTVSAPAAPTLSAFAQLPGSDGALLAQVDRPLLGLRADLLTPPAGWQHIDRRVLPASTAADAAVLLGIYNYTTGERLPAVTDGAALPDNAVRVSISATCTPQP